MDGSNFDRKDTAGNIEATISAQELSSSKKSLLQTIENNMLLEDGNDIAKGFNLSLTDIKRQVELIPVPEQDVPSSDVNYISTLESLYLLEYLKSNLDNLVSSYKIIEKVEK